MANRSNRQVVIMRAWQIKPVLATGCEWIASAVKKKALKRLVRLMFYYCLLIPLASAGNEQHFAFDIPQQRADVALRALANQADLSVVFDFDAISQHQANALSGSYAVKKAVELLLAGTGLRYEFDSSGHLIITKNSDFMGEDVMGGLQSKKQLLASVIAMFAGSAGVQGVLAQEEMGESESAWLLEEVVVTATKRETSLQDTAMSVSAISGDTIEKRGLVGMSDYLGTLPGVSMQDRGAGQNSVVIRGLSSDPQAVDSTAGVYFGEAPVSGLGSSSTLGNLGNADIKMVDIERVEVLRGPQGTLYGSDSMAGTVRVIPVSPRLDEVAGKVALRHSQTGKEGGDNSMVQGVINIPLIEDKLAVRGVVYQFENSGYVKNVAASQPLSNESLEATESFGGVARDRGDVGNDRYTGYRVSALWNPTDQLSVNLSHLDQKIEQDGMPEVNLDLADNYQQRRFNTGPEGSRYENMEADIELTNLQISYDIGWGELMSSSSWVQYDAKTEADNTHLSTPLYGFAGFDDQPFYTAGSREVENFIQEVRLSSKFDGDLSFVSGLYYEDKEDSTFGPTIWSGDDSQDPGFALFINDGDVSIEQKAIFGEITYDITSDLAVSVGGRHYDYERVSVGTLEFLGSVLWENRVTPAEESGQTYKVNLSYTPFIR